ncbi:NUDIX domain-containing protein [Actinacidiphila glaucinigra]|uniref:NUDIX domain-containing protein n=1 Tax=Actinacidiphila glaucinigra TaxID=235986 RepID=UPI002DD93098|nr:NUDIX domain-containing protein [Actinacidiphila glaucinigra]WSD62677.1 NUDIX domain-containing protein [Actinacidiphila glaucinigra]
MAHRCEAEREQRAATGLTRPRQAGSVRVCSGGPAQRAAQPCHQTDHDRPGDRSRQCGDEGEVGHRDRRRPQAAGLGQSGAGQPAAYRQRQRGGARAGSEAADDPAEPGRAPAPVGGDQREADVERPGEGELAAAVVLGADGRAFARRRSPGRRPFPDCRDITGGHVEPRETLLAALAREVAEETEWRLRAVRRLCPAPGADA